MSFVPVVAAILWISVTSRLCGAVEITFTPPTECGVMNISWTGGQPPFQFNFATVNGSQVSQSVPSLAFASGNGFYQTRILYPSGTLLLFILQDATGFPAGGTSGLLSVGQNIDGIACSAMTDTPDFDFASDDNIQQCQPLKFSGYDEGTTQPITVIGIMPGNKVFALSPPLGSTSFEWTATLPRSSTVILTMVDAAGRRGRVTELITVEQTNDSACLSEPSAILNSTASGHLSGPPMESPSVTGPGRSSSALYPSATPSPSSAVAHRTLSPRAIAGIAVAGTIGAFILFGCLVLPCFRILFKKMSRDTEALRKPSDKIEKVEIAEVKEPTPPKATSQYKNQRDDTPLIPKVDPRPPQNANIVCIHDGGPQGHWENSEFPSWLQREVPPQVTFRNTNIIRQPSLGGNSVEDKTPSIMASLPIQRSSLRAPNPKPPTDNRSLVEKRPHPPRSNPPNPPLTGRKPSERLRKAQVGEYAAPPSLTARLPVAPGRNSRGGVIQRAPLGGGSTAQRRFTAHNVILPKPLAPLNDPFPGTPVRADRATIGARHPGVGPVPEAPNPAPLQGYRPWASLAQVGAGFGRPARPAAAPGQSRGADL
ncbi:hypothetical protein GLOTRDRAFT_127190 [Gloeophyllum trabeum ATCC 11539]|uniref:Mid2 domain-containing protein n=1 Tax=Gloeophyllum trabeum (strain ATCC 11539 / FP-39264 / Madison 617) TaxID=670483 RepID=S7RV97_GLOTA|nr:uncharacterized protein GLOTRDRAFT_127190 [Gloeophyllum trabeum ATCC 11539]EPQ58700.1 hypothetical protein GLOTRDRAFT_127190 [Gloeophyllum trabeum ATCC 11539]